MEPDLKPGEQHPAVYWKPEDAERSNPFHGLFWIAESGTPMIQLHTPITPGLAGFFASAEPATWLHGRIMGHALTLQNLVMVSSTQGMRDDDPSLIRYSAGWAYIGGYWLGDDEGDQTFDQMKIRLWDQDLWTGMDAVALQMPTKATGASIHHVRPAPVVFPCSGAQWVLRDATTFTLTSMKPASNFHLDLDAAETFQGIIANWILPLQFILISSTARYCDVEYLSVRNSKLKFEDDEDEADLNEVGWLRVYASHRKRPTKKLLTATMLHRYADFPTGYDFDQLLNTVRRNRFAIDQYINLKSGLTGGHMTTFVAAAQAVEAFDRVSHPDTPVGDEKQWAAKIKAALKAMDVPNNLASAAAYSARVGYRPTLAARLKRVDRDTGFVVSTIFDTKRWADDLAAARNIVAHGLENTELLNRDVRGVQTATEAYVLLFELRFLTLIGCTPERAEELSTRRGYYWDTVRHLRQGAAQIQALAARRTAPKIAPLVNDEGSKLITALINEPEVVYPQPPESSKQAECCLACGAC